MIVDLDTLPHLSDLFNKLRSGRHLCVDDGALYLALRANFEAYRAVFGAIGFELVQHDRGFCYFRSDADLGKDATQFAVFFFVLVEAWGDAGLDIEATAFSPGGHHIADLPHFSRERWHDCMVEAGVPSPDNLGDLIRRLDRYGFAERPDDERFRLRVPAWRFFDLCRDVREESEADKVISEENG